MSPVLVNPFRYPSTPVASYTDTLNGLSGFSIRSRYKLDETSGTVATDSGPAAVDGSYVSSPLLNQTGLVTDGGKSISTTSSGGYMQTLPPSLGLSGSVTALCWYKNLASNALLFGNTGSTSSNRSNLQIIGSDIALRILGTTVTFTGKASSLTSAGRHLVALVYTNGVGWELFVDAVSQGTNSKTTDFPTAWAALRLGFAAPSVTADGNFDDLVIGNGALTAAQMSTLMAAA